MAKLADVPELESGAARHEGSSPSIRTINPIQNITKRISNIRENFSQNQDITK